MKTTTIISLTIAVVIAFTVPAALGGSKRLMSIRAAKVLAERGLVETVYGLKLRADETVENLVAISYKGRAETKTSGRIKGIYFEDVQYNPDNDIAKVAAAVKLDSITNIDGNTVNLADKVFRRTAYGTSTPGMTGAIAALRAAELDAYTQLAKQVVGFQLESQSSMENYMLTSDVVKTKVLASMYLAEVTEFGWEDNGDAFVKMQLNIGEVSDVLGQKVVGEGEVATVTGYGAQNDDFKNSEGAN